MRRTAIVLALVMLMVLATAGIASAGEVTGNGKPLWIGEGSDDPAAIHTLHGNSECAFSGLNDYYFFYEGDDPEGFGRTQNWGSIPKEDRDFLAPLGWAPGDACNPTIGEPEF